MQPICYKPLIKVSEQVTSGLTLIVVLPTDIWWRPVKTLFSQIIGTYSSIYIAGSIAVMLGLDRAALLPKNRDYLKHIP